MQVMSSCRQYSIMKKAYEIWGMSYMTTYTTKAKADRLVYEHPILDLTIREIEISWLRWFLMKLIFQ